MNTTKIIQTAGVLAIAGAAISFLMEGWNNFTGPDKFAIFSGFIFVLYLLGEIFRKTVPSLATIFQSLSLALLPSIASHLGSLIWEDASLGMIDSSLRNLTIICLIMVMALAWRLITLLKFSRPTMDVLSLMIASLFFIFPDRSSEFHALGVLVLAILAGVTTAASKTQSLSLPYSLPIRLSALIIFSGRASLYHIDNSLLCVFYLVLSAACFIYPNRMSEDMKINDVGSFLGILFLILSTYSFSEAMNFEIDATYVLLQALLLLVGISLKSVKKHGLLMSTCFAWIYLVAQIIESKPSLTVATITLAVPAIIFLAGYYQRIFAAFMSGALLLLSTLVWHFYRLIKMPVMNMWMVFGILGIVLLISSSLVGRSDSPLRQWWRNLIKVFET